MTRGAGGHLKQSVGRTGQVCSSGKRLEEVGGAEEAREGGVSPSRSKLGDGAPAQTRSRAYGDESGFMHGSGSIEMVHSESGARHDLSSPSLDEDEDEKTNTPKLKQHRPHSFCLFFPHPPSPPFFSLAHLFLVFHVRSGLHMFGTLGSPRHVRAGDVGCVGVVRPFGGHDVRIYVRMRLSVARVKCGDALCLTTSKMAFSFFCERKNALFVTRRGGRAVGFLVIIKLLFHFMKLSDFVASKVKLCWK